MVYPVQKADKYAETCNIRGITFMAFWWPQIIKIFIYAIPMFFALHFGRRGNGHLNEQPAHLDYQCAGHYRQIAAGAGLCHDHQRHRAARNSCRFPGRFLPSPVFRSQRHSAALSGLFVAFLYYLILEVADKGKEEAMDEGTQAAVEADEEGKKLLTSKDVTNLVVRWNFYCECSNSFARLQSLAFCAAFIPVLKKLYGMTKKNFPQR